MDFLLAEKEFTQHAKSCNPVDKSGSCGIVVLIVANQCYIANVGDSRAILSGNMGYKIYPLSKDHKPCDPIEHKRIYEHGGKIYQTQVTYGDINDSSYLGPYRILPGRLSVTRSFRGYSSQARRI